jgi:polysaccharide pyruvyl transferase WcaK-like protein
MPVVPLRRRLLWKGYDLRRGAELLRTSAPVGYVGWVGHGNMGDEASFEAYRRAFPERSFVAAPSARLVRPLGAARRPLVQAAALGGGTLIGWPHFRRSFEELLAASTCGGFMLGTGVEDPGYEGHNPFLPHGVRAELERWRDVFAQLPVVAVRGPRSQEVLRDVGVRAEVVGDPALQLPDLPPVEVRERLLGLNAGQCDGLWGDDLQAVVDAAVQSARTLRDSGWQVRLVPLSPSDPPVLREIARALDGHAQLVDGYRDLARLREALAECHVFVGQKLHSVVLASGAGVPAVALEYHPKCRDFQRSLGRERFTVRTDALGRAQIVELVDELAGTRDEESRAIGAAIGELRARWHAARDAAAAA